MSKAELPASCRALSRLVREAVACNPFSERRIELDRELSGCSGRTDRSEALAAAVEKVASVLRDLERQGSVALREYGAEDRQLLTTTVLFHLFHRHIEDFDRHILEQMERVGEPLRVPFARDILASMAGRGVPEREARHYLAKFYQLRRAYYFIFFAAHGKSPCMQELRRQLWNNIFTFDTGLYDRHMWNRMEDFSTIILGETGTGKGVAALAIGRSGFIPFDPKTECFAQSFTETFLSINLSQFTPSLIESELFGHRKGAFTGAIDNHEGVLARCSPHGAIFLDEIGDVDIPIQIKLLQVLQERTFSPVGSHERKRFHGRVIAATNKPLDELRRSGRFRDDFYYRLCSDEITVPPLRERIQQEPAELDELAERILKRLCGEEVDELKAMVVESLRRAPGEDYTWPGNVRELEQAVRRTLLKGTYEGRRSNAEAEDGLVEGIHAGTLSAKELLTSYTRLLYARFGTYEEVARRTGLDRRTAKKYIEP